MKNKLVIVIDLGCLKAYRVEYDELSSHPRLELIESFDMVDAHGRLSDKLTDAAGRFPGGDRNVVGVRTCGERHNIQLELNKRIIRLLAASVGDVVKREDPALPVLFAAAKEIYHPVLAWLKLEVRARIEKVVPEDLTKISGVQLLNHFATA